MTSFFARRGARARRHGAAAVAPIINRPISLTGVVVIVAATSAMATTQRHGQTSHTRRLMASTTTVIDISGFGLPFPPRLVRRSNSYQTLSLNTADLQLVAGGQLEFVAVEELPRVGPIMNSRSCGSCHFQPAMGGSGAFINEIRVRNNTAGGPLHIFAVDNMLRSGPQTQGAATIFANGLPSAPLGCQITSRGCEPSLCQQEEASRTTFSPDLDICDPTSPSYAAGTNCVGERQSTPLFGLGLVEAVADSTFDGLAANQPSAIRGVVKRIPELGATRVARFGWKDDHAALRAFCGDAYLNEMGVTNPDFPNERSACVVDTTLYGVVLDADDDPEDITEDDGRADIDRFADFIRALSPPPQLAMSSDAKAGHLLFTSIHCDGCHVENLTTSAAPATFIPPTTGGVPVSSTLGALLAGQTFHPFSDFLLHDMGALGDGIISGTAGPTQMRTAPLWGVRARSRFLHDGRATTIADAISLHAGQGAAAAAVFEALSAAQQQQLLAFLLTI